MGLSMRLKNILIAKGADDVHKKDAWLVNDDIRPLALKDRTWGRLTYFFFWFSAAATVSNWYSASAAQALGLSLWEAVGCALSGQVLIAAVFVLNGRPGAVYHVGFPILNRAAFGVFGAWWPTFNRAVMATVWNGVNGVQGGQCVYVMLHAIFPSIATLPNKMGSGSALTTGGMIGYVVFWIVTCCFLIIPIPKMRWLIYTKLCVFVISAITMLAWTLTLAGGLGPVARQPGTATGSAKTWLIIRFVLLGAANSATFASNAADFQRYSKKPNDVILGNIVGFPLACTTVNIVGALVGASSSLIFGSLIWNPLNLLDAIQTQHYTPANRAGCFFIAFMFVYCAIFSSIFENSIPAGNDISALFPKYISIRTGMYICQVISFAINPWYLLGSASIFISFLSSYQVFLSSITGVLLCNYWIISRGYFKIPDLFTSNKSGVYHFTHGWNIRAYIAYILGIAPNFYGFLNNMGVKAPIGITHFYYFAYPVGLLTAFFTFWIANLVSPPAHSFPLHEWHGPKNYFRPEEDFEGGEVVEGVSEQNSQLDDESEKRVDKVATVGENFKPVRSL